MRVSVLALAVVAVAVSFPALAQRADVDCEAGPVVAIGNTELSAGNFCRRFRPRFQLRRDRSRLDGMRSVLLGELTPQFIGIIWPATDGGP